MPYSNLKELKKLIQLCRNTGISSIKIEGLELTFGPAPIKRAKSDSIDLSAFPEANIKVPSYTPYTAAVKEVADQIATDELSEEQLMFYSSRPESFEGQQ